MPRKTYRPPYRQQIVDSARSGESAVKLSQRFESSAKTIRDCGGGHRTEGAALCRTKTRRFAGFNVKSPSNEKREKGRLIPQEAFRFMKAF